MKFFFLLLFLPFQLLAQPTKDITGLWKGYISTSEKKLPYELVITTKNDTLSGFSYTTFTVNGQEIVSMKKVKVRWHKLDVIVEDDDNLYNNFPDDAPKKIMQTNTLSLSDKAEHLRLFGDFETKGPKQFKRAKGEVFLEKKDNSDDTKLMAKLDEMKLTSSLSFSFASVKTNPADSVSLAVRNKPIPAIIPGVVENIKTPATIDSIALLRSYSFTKAEPAKTKYTRQPASKIIMPMAIVLHKPRKEFQVSLPTSSPVIASVTKPKPSPAVLKPTAAAKAIVQNKPVVKASTLPAVAKAPAPKPQPVNIAVAPVIDLAKRKIETIDKLYIEADSLQFTLYDNGEVDGDTVSIIMNGKTIVSRQGLTTAPFTKTIYFTPDLGDSIQLVMYAETLGTIAPNTGLLILNYDKQRREIRFSGDLNNNAAITLRRKEKE
jgi:hypothetical protein